MGLLDLARFVRCDRSSPECGHAYVFRSKYQPGGVYQVAAAIHWVIDWTATTGESGQFTADRTAAAVGELQVVNS